MNVDITRSTGDAVSRRLIPDTTFEGVQLLRYLRQSPLCWRATIDGQSACIWGLIPPCLLSEKAYLWLWHNEVAEQHTFLLVRYSQRMVEEILKEFSTIVGHCETSNHRAQRWLKWLGAEFSFPEGKLIPFTIRRK